MATVNGIVEYQKVMKLAPNCVRMALGIDTAHTFNVIQLFAKLCHMKCDGKNCDTYAPYLDVFTLTRRCLSIGGGCRTPLGPINSDILDRGNDPNADFSTLRKFRPLGNGPVIYRGLTKLGKRCTDVFHDYVQVKTMLQTRDNSEAFDYYDKLTIYEDPYWKLCVAMTPWLSVQGFHAEYGVFCTSCENPKIEKSGDLLSIDLANSQRIDGKPLNFPDLYHIPFMRSDQL